MSVCCALSDPIKVRELKCSLAEAKTIRFSIEIQIYYNQGCVQTQQMHEQDILVNITSLNILYNTTEHKKLETIIASKYCVDASSNEVHLPK